MKRISFVFAVLGALLLLAGPAAAQENPPPAPSGTDLGEIPRIPDDASLTSHRVVLITDDALNPDVVALDEGQLVAWISYSGAESGVGFARDVARDMRCHSLVNFAFADDELRSAPIRAGEFASFCELRPGRYEYKVVRPIRVKPDEASRELKGEIVVGDPDA